MPRTPWSPVKWFSLIISSESNALDLSLLFKFCFQMPPMGFLCCLLKFCGGLYSFQIGLFCWRWFAALSDQLPFLSSEQGTAVAEEQCVEVKGQGKGCCHISPQHRQKQEETSAWPFHNGSAELVQTKLVSVSCSVADILYASIK